MEISAPLGTLKIINELFSRNNETVSAVVLTFWYLETSAIYTQRESVSTVHSRLGMAGIEDRKQRERISTTMPWNSSKLEDKLEDKETERISKRTLICYLGMAAMQVLKRSIFGFLSPLQHSKRNSQQYHSLSWNTFLGGNFWWLVVACHYNRSVCTHVIISSASLCEQCGLVIITGLPTCASSPRMMLSKALRIL